MKCCLVVSGMACAACAMHVENALLKAGATEVSVNLATGKAYITGDDIDVGVMIAAVKSLGYGAALPEDYVLSGAERRDLLNRRIELYKTVGACLFAFYFLLGMMLHLVGVHDSFFFGNGYVQLACASASLTLGYRFFVRAFYSIKSKAIGMDVLISLSTGSAFFYSLALVVQGKPGDIYFEAASVIIAVVMVGKLIEGNAINKATRAIDGLTKLMPEKATVLRDGEMVEVDAASLKVGDSVVIVAGDRIPADGEIISGDSAVDESAVTGESLPVDKCEGDYVLCGTVNLFGTFTFRVAAAQEQAFIGKVAREVGEAQSNKTQIQRFADAVSGYFCLGVLSVAAIVFVVFAFIDYGSPVAFQRAIAVLVVACPCALGLAAPLAVLSGTALGASRGILFRKGGVLEVAGKTRKVYLDKTGTITTGKPKVVEFTVVRGNPEVVAELVGAAEALSEHPLGKAVAAHFPTKFTASSFTPVVGKGVVATVNGFDVVIGSGNYMEELGYRFTTMPAQTYEEATALFVVVSGEMCARIELADPIKDGAVEAVRRFKKMGIECVVLSGDSESPVRAVASRIGVDRYYHSVLPSDKAGHVKASNSMFCGDGINDSPALASAATGVAMGNGSALSMQSADVTVVGESLRALPEIVRISRVTMLTIILNLSFAFIYNVVAVPFAIMGVLTMQLSALCMALSSVSVALSTLATFAFVKYRHE